MKNSTISKFILGLFLIGFMTSSVFAALENVTKNVIHGNKPVIYQVTDPTIAHTLTVRVTKDEAGTVDAGVETIKVDQYIHIKYKLQDKDGDIDTKKDDANSSVVMPTLKVFINGPKMEEGKTVYEWREVTLDNAPKFKIENGIAIITFQIDLKFIGATKIGFKLLERTEYGVPYVNNWLNVTDILSIQDPYVRTAIASNGTVDKSGPDLTTLRGEVDKVKHEFGPGDPYRWNGIYPVESKLVKAGIFKYNDQDKLDKKVNYAPTKPEANPPIPKYGDKFGVVVWLDNDDNDLPDEKELDFTENYDYAWYLVGTYEEVKAAVAPLTFAQGISNDYRSIRLGSTSGKDHNKIYATEANGYKAGAQGYNLSVVARSKVQ